MRNILLGLQNSETVQEQRILCSCLFYVPIGLAACGSKSLKVSAVEDALADFDGILNMESSGNKVKSFTYEIHSEDLLYVLDKSYAREALYGLMNNDVGNLTLRHLRVAENYSAVMFILGLFEKEDDFSARAFTDKLLDLVCDGRNVKYDGWVVSRELNLSTYVITIVVEKG